MLAEESSGGVGQTIGWARLCDACRTAACTVYCRPDSAYLCTACDAAVHAASRHHERVWVCEACESAPAVLRCNADSASLCASCDADIHSANPLARRHHRVPVTPPNLGPAGTDEEAESWPLLLDNSLKNSGGSELNNGVFFFSGDQVDEFLDLADYNSCADQCNQAQGQDHQRGVPQKVNYVGDSVVPFQFEHTKDLHQNFQLGTGYSVPVSSMEVGVVPESTTTGISFPHSRPSKSTVDHFPSPPPDMPPQLTPMDREARVLRYKEKKKTRKFEKTIRYASRKAYAETRPRIKGRFAKRTDNIEVEMDQMRSGYGVVPSF